VLSALMPVAVMESVGPMICVFVTVIGWPMIVQNVSVFDTSLIFSII